MKSDMPTRPVFISRGPYCTMVLICTIFIIYQGVPTILYATGMDQDLLNYGGVCYASIMASNRKYIPKK